MARFGISPSSTREYQKQCQVHFACFAISLKPYAQHRPCVVFAAS